MKQSKKTSTWHKKMRRLAAQTEYGNGKGLTFVPAVRTIESLSLVPTVKAQRTLEATACTDWSTGTAVQVGGKIKFCNATRETTVRVRGGCNARTRRQVAWNVHSYTR